MNILRLIRQDVDNFMDWRNSYGVAGLRARKEGLIPDTIWIVRASKPSVTASFFNDIEKDIHLDYCIENGIPVRRTIGGGGCAFFDEGAIYCMAFFSIKGHLPNTHSEIFALLHPSIARSLSKRLGIEAYFRPLNDLQVGQRKFSLAGLVIDEGVAYLILILQVKKPTRDLTKILNLPPEKMADKETKTLEDRTTWLEREAGRIVSLDEVEEACMEGISKALNAEIVSGDITDVERRYAQEAFKRLNSFEFQMERTETRRFGKISSDIVRSEHRIKVKNGPFIRAVVLIKNGILHDLLITGSIMATPLEPQSPIDEIEKNLKGSIIDPDEIRKRIRHSIEKEGYMIAGADADTFFEAIWGAIKKGIDGSLDGR
jgi:lipoate-protein ligase A